jgi:hypothetical protein
MISFGCVEETNPVGSNILPAGDTQKLKIDTLYATGHYTQPALTNNSDIDRFFVGTCGSLTSWGMLRFSMYNDTIVDRPILSARIRLKVVGHYGDSLATLSFAPYRMLAGFSGDTLSFDSLQTNPSFYYDPTPIGKVFSRSHIGDADYIEFSIDTNTVRDWITHGDTLNFGILLKPENTNVIKGFYSYNSDDSSLVPKLSITFKDTNNISQTYEDTTSTSRFLAHIDSTSLNKDRTMLYVQAGVPYRGILTFNVDSLPMPCVINSATLEMTQNTTLTKLTGAIPDSLLSMQLYDDGSLSSSSYGVSTNTLKSTGTGYKFDTRVAVQSWVTTHKNLRLMIVGYEESYSFDRHVLYGSNAAVSQDKRPRIILTYSTK